MKYLLAILLFLPMLLKGVDNVTLFHNMTNVATFHSIGVVADYVGDDNSNAVCAVFYRPNSTGDWKQGLNLWNDTEDDMFRGSIVLLEPNTEYQVRIDLSDTDGVPPTSSITNTVSTWSESFNVTVEHSWSSTSNTVYNITTNGPLGGYHAYGPANGEERITIGCSTNYPLIVTAHSVSNIIIRNIDFVGGLTNVIYLSNDCVNVIIDRCTFTHYGAIGTAPGPSSGYADEGDNAVILVGKFNRNPNNTSRIVVQNCTFNEPIGNSNSWDDGHPTGAHATYYCNTLGNHVWRYNYVFGKDGNKLNDVIGGQANSGLYRGGLTANSDLYGNLIAGAWDDGFEVEGPGLNNRLWHNVTTNMNTAIGLGAIRQGPTYVFRNVHMESHASEATASDDETAYKVGIRSQDYPMKRVYYFHNTIDHYSQSHANAIAQNSGTNLFTVSSNNIFTTSAKVVADNKGAPENTSVYDYDLMLSGATYDVPSGSYANLITGTPVYVSTNDYERFLDTGSPGLNAGVGVPNFSQDASGDLIASPDVGAFDSRFVAWQLGPQSSSVVTVRMEGGLIIRGVVIIQ